MKNKHRTYLVECIIFNRYGEVMLQKKTHDAPFFAGGWLLFGGGIDDLDETPDEAIKRELKEEMGLDFDPKFLSAEKDDDRFVFTFELELNDISKINLTEGNGFAFFPVEEIQKYLNTRDRIKTRIKRWKNERRSN